VTSKTLGRLFIAPAAALLAAVGTGPLLYALYAALHSFPAESDAAPEFRGLGNLVDLFRDPQFVHSLALTGVVLVIAVGLQLFLGLLLALALHTLGRSRGVVMSLLLVPSSMAPLVAGIAWWMLFNPQTGPVNALLEMLGATPVQWTVRMPWALLAIVVALVWQWTPFVAVILLGGLTTVPASVLEAARLDGAGPWAMLRHVLLPHLRPFFLVSGLLMMIEVVRLYEMPYYITQGGPGNETVLAGIYLFKLAFTFRNLGGASMMALLFTGLLTIVSIVYVRLVMGRPNEAQGRMAC
jgi:multiple sugar transport system permease protein